MNPNRSTLLQQAEEKLAANLQLPPAELNKIRILDLPILSFQDGVRKVYGQNVPNGDFQYLPSDWTGLAVRAFEGENYVWLLSKDIESGETEYWCLGAPQTVQEALNKASRMFHADLIIAQRHALEQTGS